MTRTRTANPRRRAPRRDGFTERARRAIDSLLRQFPELREELAHGTGSTPGYAHAVRDPSPEQAARRGAEAAEDRAAALWNAQHGLAASGPGGAPLRLSVLDTDMDITASLAELEEAVHDRLGLPAPRNADVPTRLVRLLRLLDTIGRDADLAEHVLAELRRMARRCARVLGDTEPIRRIRPRCPLCDSVSLRAFTSRHIVLCVNPGCRCEDENCACHHTPGARHRWERAAWAELAVLVGCTVDDLAEVAA
ncbi:hypothetical protein [Yinghuangia soli]|uniref:Uncharacterized protein n=1 Tax=Yinghuangia soli TaxID=2908204 RepID=A0AA41Q349_9ACTN|nr:hypothetical protein [Yinghuangia soli]MCF2530673.1 hypothetical protein [Yinghuangia soli]